MKISRQMVAENRQHLLAVATDEFREHGIDGVSVADLMKAAGMSLGSFYGYFDSKEQLVAACCSAAIRQIEHKLCDPMKKDDTRSFDQVIDGYLSAYHRDHRAQGCVLAALGSDLAGQDEAVRGPATEAVRHLLAALAGKLPGSTKKKREDAAIATLAMLMGSLTLARIVNAPELSLQVLESTKAAVKSAGKASRKTQHAQPRKAAQPGERHG